MIEERYALLVQTIKNTDMSTLSNTKDLLSMAYNIRTDCRDDEYCYREITGFIKDHWLEWLIRSKDSGFEELYYDALLFEAPYKVDSFFRFLDRDERGQGFYAPRAACLAPIINAYQAMYDGKLDLLAVSQPKRTGKTSSALRLVAMISGRNPQYGTLCTGAGESLVSVFYQGILKIFQSAAFQEVFPAATVAKTQADRMNIDLEERHQFTTVQVRPIDGAIVGNTEARNLLYIDDAVKNHEEAMNRTRLNFLAEKITGDVLGRRIPGVTPILIQGTRYSIYDPIGVLVRKAQELGWRYRVVAIPALDPVNDESNFECVIDGQRLFTTEDYRNEKKLVTPEVWGAEFQQEPFESKGRMFPEEELNRYVNLPVDVEPDAILAACDTAESGADYCACIIGYVYGEEVFVHDVVYDNSPSGITKSEVAGKLLKHKVGTAQFESNSAGGYYARDVEKILKQKGGKCSFRLKRSVTNKLTRIDEASSRIIQNFYFKDDSLIKKGSQYHQYLRELTSMTRSGKVPHDDGSDATAMLDSLVRSMAGIKVTVADRSALGF